MEIIFSPEAEQDMLDIFDTIMEENLQAAEKVLEYIRQEILRLYQHPYLGRPGRVPKTRELVLSRTPFIVPYQVIENKLEILRVYHTSRKWPQRFD